MFFGILFVLGGFLLSIGVGAVPVGYLIASLKGIDLRTRGSGNIGATNTLRTLGAGWGIFVLLFDCVKAYFTVYLFNYFHDNGFFSSVAISKFQLISLIAIGVLVGNCFNPFLKFKGGKGVATSTGLVLFLSPNAFLFGIAVFTIVFAVKRIVSLGSLFSLMTVVLTSFIRRDNIYISLCLLILGSIVIYRHFDNIKRILRGEEKPLSFKKI